VESPKQHRGRGAHPGGTVTTTTLLTLAGLCLSTHAAAQSNACDMLKASLASRIPPEIKGYSMDAVPAKAPVPPGGKVIGNCDGGAFKIVYRRFGGTPVAAAGEGGAEASAASASPTGAPAASMAKPVTPAPAPVPVVAAPPPAPKPAPPPPAPPAPPPPAPVPAPAPPAVPRLPDASAPPASAPLRGPVLEPPPAVSIPAPMTDTEKPPAPVETSTEAPIAPSPWRWAWALLALPALAWLGAWIVHRRAYDSAGLPRGPKLN